MVGRELKKPLQVLDRSYLKSIKKTLKNICFLYVMSGKPEYVEYKYIMKKDLKGCRK